MDFKKMKDLHLARRTKINILALTGLLAVVTAAGLVINQGMKKSVSVNLDGNKKEVKTNADTVGELLKELDVEYKERDYVDPSINTEIKDKMKVVWKPSHLVTLNIDGDERKVWTTAKTVEQFLKEEKIRLRDQDRINVPVDAEVKDGMKIDVDIAFKIVLNDGGEEERVWAISTTVGDFLKDKGIKLNELDRVKPDLDEKVKKDSKIIITRVKKVTDVVEEPIDFSVVTKKDNNLLSGREKVVQQGETGKVQRKYEVVLENGKEVSKKLISEKIIKEAKDKIVAVGTKQPVQTVAKAASGGEVSRGSSSGKEFYVNATAYTANCNGCTGKTATGMDLRANPNAKVIAVDPNVIPLGSKVYVEGYGYAVAADTGGRIKGNRIDVFLPSKSAAYQWGTRKVKVKILQ